MRYRKFSLIFLFSTNFLIGCSKNQNIQSTQLRVDLVDETGNKVSGAMVRLYKPDGVDPGITKTSDDIGQVLFSDLQPVQYFFLAVKGCKNNSNDNIGAAPGYGSLLPNTLNYIGATLSENGALQINNNSTDSFVVAINVLNRELTFEVPSHDSIIINPDIGLNNLHSEKENASGTGVDSLIQISCNDTTIIHLPY